MQALAQQDFLVNQSRVFTLGGGDILIWSSSGDIDAGTTPCFAFLSIDRVRSIIQYAVVGLRTDIPDWARRRCVHEEVTQSMGLRSDLPGSDISLFDEAMMRGRTELTRHDPLGSHVRDELGIRPGTMAQPVQAAVVSATSFAVGAALGARKDAITNILDSEILDSDTVEVIGNLGAAAAAADAKTQGHNNSVGGIFAIMRELKDPQVQNTLAFKVFFGRQQALGQTRNGYATIR